MAAAGNGGGNGGVRAYLPLIITVVLAVAPVLVLGGRMINRLDYLEVAVRERASDIQQNMNNLADAADARWQARDRQAEAGELRLRTLAEMLIALQRDLAAAANVNARQDETVKQTLARLERLVERLGELERAVRPYPGGSGHQ